MHSSQACSADSQQLEAPDMQVRTRPEAMWQEREWFAKSAPVNMRDLPNVGVHYLQRKVTDWLLNAMTTNLADFKENVKTK